MPVIQTIEARRSFDIGGIPDTRVDNSIGQGISQLGNAIGNAADAQNALANRRLEMQRQADEFAANQSFQRWQDDNALEFGQSQQKMDPSGRGFTDTVSGIYTKRSEEFLKSVPANLQPRFQELVATARNQWIDKGAAAEIDQRNTWYRTGITERQQTLQNQVFNDPAMFDAAKNDAYRTIEASGLPPAEKEALKKKTDEMFSLTVGEREIRNAEANPDTADGAAGRLGVTGAVTTSRGGDAMSIIRQFEGYRDTPYWDVNAHRVGYGSDTVTTSDGRKVKVEPGMKISRADAERDLARRTKEFERGAASKVGVEAWNNLAPNVQAALVSVAYNYGNLPDNVAEAARSGDVYAIATAVDARSGDNGGVNRKRRMEEANIIRGNAQIKGNAPAFDPSSMDPRFANLSLSQRLSLYDQMQAAAKRGQIAIDAQQTAAYNQQKGALQLGIQTGEIASSEQILSSGMTDSDKATLISALRSRQGDQIATAEAVAAFQAGGLTVDPYSTDGRKRVDAVGDVISKAVPPEQQQAAYEELVRQSGTLPQSVLNKIRAGADSQVASEVEAAMNAASRFAQVNPSALGRREGGEAIQRKADDFDYYVNTLNLSPSDAARRIAEQNDPNKVRDRKALEPAAKEFRKQLEGADIGAIFDDSVLGWRSNPNVGFTEGQAAGIAADYLAIAEEQFYATGGNTELAKSRANQEMKRLYGVTEIGGSRTIMKYPPEKFWPSMPGASDPYAYAKDQLVNDLAAAFPDDATLNPKKNGSGFVGTVAGRTVDIRDESGVADYRNMVKDDVLSRVILVATPETGAEVKSNQLPGYTVLYKDAQGNLQTLYGKQWRPDPKVVSDEARQQQADRLGRAQIYQQTGQGIADFLQGGEIPMGAGQAWDNPEAQQTVPPQPQTPTATVPSTPTPTIQGNLSQQRSELFQNARNSGMLTPGGM
ncbi:lysozyme [Brucella tritici]|uniref:lysozyme n=1 Tax=Brucella tritici TaxID=94626 RepID=UPI002001A96D|nr:hypothetical protein [Brucella tritici]